MNPSPRTFRLHYHDGHVETREAFGYTDAGPRIVFHRLKDKSDRDFWENRTLLIMIADEGQPEPDVAPISIIPRAEGAIA